MSVLAVTVHKPKNLDLVSKSFANSSTDLGFLRLSADPWSMLDDISIDYAIMEKVQNLVAVPYASKWSDLGGWDAVWFESAPDRSGNAISQNAHAIECSNSLLRSESKSQQLVGIGLDNIIAVSMPDAVLVADKQRAQDVKKVVELLKSKDVMQAEVFPKDHRPWGWFESLVLGDCFGYDFLDKGQRRVPDPPASKTGYILDILYDQPLLVFITGSLNKTIH